MDKFFTTPRIGSPISPERAPVVDFRSRCPFHPQLMSNLPCAPRFTSVVGLSV
jgi:hypothetical protein